MYKMAKAHFDENGYALAPKTSSAKLRRHKFDDETIRLIVEFMTSSEIIQDVAFGVFTDKKNQMQIPRVARLMMIKHCIEANQALLIEHGKKPPATSTFYKLIKFLPAVSTKLMGAINPTIHQGRKAFGDLKKIINQLDQMPYGLSSDDKMTINTMIENAHTYIHTRFSYNIELESKIPSHCSKLALSDPESEKFSDGCELKHVETCADCDNIFYMFEAIEKAISIVEDNGHSAEECADIKFDVKVARDQVYAYKHHLIRAFAQNSYFENMMFKAGCDTVFIHQDFMMNVLPKRFRTPMNKWFGDVGKPVHVIVFQYKIEDRENGGYKWVTEVYFQVLEDLPKKDSRTTFALWDAALKVFARSHPLIVKCYGRSDNAANYHCDLLISLVWANRNNYGQMVVQSYIFTEAGDGKSKCDGFSSMVKMKRNKYIVEAQFDSESPAEIAAAFVGKEPMANSVVQLGRIINYDSEFKPPKAQLKGVTKFSHFEFTDEEISVWKQSKIGEGQTFKNLDKHSLEELFDFEIVTENGNIHVDETTDPEILKPKNKSYKEVKKPDKMEVRELAGENSDCVYKCPRKPCQGVFQSYNEFQQHLTENDCFIDKKDESTGDNIRRQYFSKLSLGSSTGSKKIKSHLVPLTNIAPPEHLKSAEGPKYSKGYALPAKRIIRRFLDSEKAYLTDEFNRGQLTKPKITALVAMENMRNARDSQGKKLFTPPYLNDLQIDSFFNRLYAAIKNRTISDTNEDSEEIQTISQERNAEHQAVASAHMNQELLTLIANDDTGSSSDHPLEENRLNLCEIALNYLAHKGKRRKLFLEDYSVQEVHSVFQKLDIALPKVPTSYRALAKFIFKYVSTNCPEKCCNL